MGKLCPSRIAKLTLWTQRDGLQILANSRMRRRLPGNVIVRHRVIRERQLVQRLMTGTIVSRLSVFEGFDASGTRQLVPFGAPDPDWFYDDDGESESRPDGFQSGL